MTINFSAEQIQKISLVIYVVTGHRAYVNRSGNISFETSRFCYTLSNYSTIENPKFILRKRNIRCNEYHSVWIVNRSRGVINYFKSVNEFKNYFTNYVNKDPHRLTSRYYDFSFGTICHRW